MPIMLTPEQERRVTAYATQRQESVKRVIDTLIKELPVAEPEAKPLSEIKTRKEALRELIAEQERLGLYE